MSEHREEDATRAETPGARQGSLRPDGSAAAPSLAPASIASDPPSSIRDRSVVASSTSASFATAGTPLETMVVEEIARARIFFRYAFAIALAVAPITWLIGGDLIAKWVAFASEVAVLFSSAWFTWRVRTDAQYTLTRALIAATPCIAGAFGGIWFFGVFSPAVVILPWGLYYFSAAQSFRATFGVVAICGLGYAAMCIGLTTGLFVDRGIIRADGVHTLDRLAILAFVELTLLATFLVSRTARRATLRALELHDRAVRGIAQREALLEEARLDLQQALMSGGLGRFSDTQLGSFRLGKLIGRGAMGEVYEATQTGTTEVAAVKLLQAHVLHDAELVRRFLREAKIAASLDVPNVVRVLEVGGVSPGDAPFPYIAMERLRGEDLADHLRAHRRLSLSRTVNLVREVGRGLEAAREAGIVHRDLKPRNLFHAEISGARGSTGHVWKILDFGVSKLMDGEGTQTKDHVVGTPAYMAPEQASGGEVSHLTDLYALGVIAYRVITGRPAFTGDHTPEILYQVVYQMPPQPSTIVKLAPEVDLVLALAMAKKEGDRFASAASFADALEAASHGVIDPELRARGERLLAKSPWGSGVRAPAAPQSLPAVSP